VRLGILTEAYTPAVPCSEHAAGAMPPWLRRWATLALLLPFLAFCRGIGSTVPSSAQTGYFASPSGGGCGSLGDGTFTCLFNPPVLEGAPGSPAALAVTVTRPAGVAVVSAGAVDPLGNGCTRLEGAGPGGVTLTCAAGLAAGATASATFQPVADAVGVVVSYTGSAPPAAGGRPTDMFLFPYRPPAPSIPPEMAGRRTYAGGWNLVGGPSGWNLYGGAGFSPLPGPLYTYQAGDTDYRQVSAGAPLLAGVGAWVYVAQPLAGTLWGEGRLPQLTVALPPSHWVTVANPGFKVASVDGADGVYTYDSDSGAYLQTTTLQAGEGAWVYSANGGTVTISPASP